MSRPADLPDYGAPPLIELVMGVQFTPIQNYSAVDAGAIWELFREDFPVVVEQAALPPRFETFGGGPSPGVQIQFGPTVGQTRLWFVTHNNDHLLQFQPDRFLLNWRQNNEGTYPRYEQIASTFREKLSLLRQHILDTKMHELEINQIEITYINIIPVENMSEQSRWLKIMPAFGFPTEAVNATLIEVVYNDDRKPIARLHHDLKSVISLDGQNRAFQLDLTFRGKPAAPGIEGAMELLGKGRASIVKRFTELTTDEAHKSWERKS